MALNADVGTPESNSYCTILEGDAYFLDRLHGSATWTSLILPGDDTSQQESALITCSRLIDWYNDFKGVKVDEDNGLDWPRTGSVRSSGVAVDDDIIPVEVKQAVFELVLSSAISDRTADDPLAGLSQATAGPLTVKTDGGGSNSTAKEVIPEHIKKLLSDLTVSSGGVVRLVRG